MDISINELALINAFQNGLEIFKDYDSVDANIATYQAFSHFNKAINTLASDSYSFHAEYHKVQDRLRGKLKYSVQELLTSDRLDVRGFLDHLLDQMPVLKLTGYSLQVVSSVHDGYFLPRYQQELNALAQAGPKYNLNPLDRSLYVTYSTFCEIAEVCPKFANEILSLFINHPWGAGYRAAAAKQLFLLGSTDILVRIWKALSDNQLNDSALDDAKADTCLMLWIKHLVNARSGSQCIRELAQLEFLLLRKARQKPDSALANFSANKWQGSAWQRKEILCYNGWSFELRRSPFLDRCQLWVPGGEVARDQVEPSCPEQLEWLEELLAQFDPKAYSTNWVIEFSIFGQSVLQALLIAIRHLGVENEQDYIG